MLNGINIFKPNQFQRHLADPYKVENQQKNKIKMKKFGNYIMVYLYIKLDITDIMVPTFSAIFQSYQHRNSGLTRKFYLN